jgi:hypothetical protein
VTETTVQFTRSELAEYVQPAFAGARLVERTEMLKTMDDRGAPQPMIDLVGERVPEGTRLREMRALWHYLGDLPLERETP